MYSDRRDERREDESERRSFRDDRHRAPDRQRTTANVFVGGVSPNTSERTLDELFSKFGKIDKIVMKNGFSFVEYENAQDALDAIKNLDGTEIDGNKVRCDMSRRGGERRDRDPYQDRDRPSMDKPRILPPTQYRIIIEGIASGASWQDIKDTLRRVGEVVYVDVYNQQDSFAIAEFKTEDEMKKCIETMNNTEMTGRIVTVKEDPEKERPRMYFQRQREPQRRPDSQRRPDFRRDDYRRDEYRGEREEYRRDDYRGRDDYRSEEYPPRGGYRDDDYRRGDRRY